MAQVVLAKIGKNLLVVEDGIRQRAKEGNFISIKCRRCLC